MPRVSIVIPFYNAERFLRETLDSVFAQIFTDWELILVNDGSFDGSAAVAREFQARAPERVRSIEHTDCANKGIGPSRNAGIRAARGEWIALLDSDDVWIPEKLGRQIFLAREHPSAGIIFGRARYWQSWNHGHDWIHQQADLEGAYAPPALLLATILGHTSPPPPSDVIFKRTLFHSVGGFEPEFPNIYEDQVFLAKCMAVAPAYISGECWTWYRRHANSVEAIAGSNGELAYSERLRFLRWLHCTFTAHPDQQIRTAVVRKTWPLRRGRLHRFLWRTSCALKTRLNH